MVLLLTKHRAKEHTEKHYKIYNNKKDKKFIDINRTVLNT